MVDRKEDQETIMYKIQTLNNISPVGLQEFPQNLYHIASEIADPDAILVRSHEMHTMTIPTSTRVIGRAGAGVNNIPVELLTKRGIPVINTPGANANAVRELVIAGMLMASRNLAQALHYLKTLANEKNFTQLIEQQKKQFQGFELLGKTLGVIGLGNIGVRVANAAANLGMRVIGYDPAITVSNAWELVSEVQCAASVDNLIAQADFITFHVPLLPETHHMINQQRIKLMKNGVTLLNFAREEIIDERTVIDALNEKKIHAYVTDFPTPLLYQHERVISLPHLGASTKEAEENCAVILAKRVREFLEHGSIVHATNFPQLHVPALTSGIRLAIVNANIPNMVAQISVLLAKAGLNIVSLLNQSRNEIAYTVIDLAHDVKANIIDEIKKIDGVLQLHLFRQV